MSALPNSIANMRDSSASLRFVMSNGFVRFLKLLEP